MIQERRNILKFHSKKPIQTIYETKNYPIDYFYAKYNMISSLDKIVSYDY